MKQFARITNFLARMFGSKPFLFVVLGFFALESLWVALSALYPMAFDEDFHFGIIKIYSQHWLPFLGGQPPNSAAFGAVVRDPSYLYHYLMSFPYRVVAEFTHSQMIQVIILRLINIGLCGLGLGLFWKLLRRVGVSAALANVALALFVLIPIVPLLAGQINYDNLMLPLVAWLCLVVAHVTEQLRAKRVNLKSITLLVVICCLGSIVKYPFLPLALIAVLFLTGVGWWSFRTSGKDFWPAVVHGFRLISTRVRIGLIVAAVLGVGLFAQRYATNLFAYHTPIPHCETVLSVDECMDYGPWVRDYTLAQSNTGAFNHSPIYYAWQWLYGMWMRLFFMITGPTNDYRNNVPLPAPAGAAIVIGVLSFVVLALRGWRVLRKNPVLGFLLLLSGVYIAVLFVDNYSAYLRTGQPVAINGRYLLPVLLPVVAVVGVATSSLLKRWPSTKPLLASLAIVLFLQGGGVFSFIVRSDPSWDWPNNAVVNVNNGARKVIWPLIPGKDSRL